ncbi:Initiation factor 2B-related [Trinorchestia longiramus]|nr:Initiation factor 2B-related [Trinorchestia longiramus]
MGKKSPKNSPKKQEGTASKSSPPNTGKKGATCKKNEQQKSSSIPPKKPDACSDGEKGLVSSMDKLSVEDKSKSCDSKNVSVNSTSQPDTINIVPSVQTPALKQSSPKEVTSQSPLPQMEDKSECPNPWCFEQEMETFLDLLDCVYCVPEHDKAVATFDLIRGLVSEDNSWKTPRDLMDRMMSVYAEIGAKVPHDTTSRNIILKLRKMLLDEFREATKDLLPTPSKFCGLHFLRCMGALNDVLSLDAVEMPQLPESADLNAITHKVKEGVLALMMEYEMELENIPAQIVNQAKKIIVEDDVVMTYAYCPIVAQLLISAARHCNYTLYVVESQPLCYGYLLLDDLRGNNVNVVLIPDCNVGALMPKMTKVVMPCHAVLADGGLKTLSFGGVISHVAKLEGKQVYVVAANYQFTPPMVANVNLDLDATQLVVDVRKCNVGFFLKKFDRTDCSDVAKIITNAGSVMPTQAQRVMADMYNPRLDNEEPLPMI